MSKKFGSLVEKLGSVDARGIIAGLEITPITRGITLAKGSGTLATGTVLGKVAASGLCVPVNSAKDDGSQTPYAILAEDVAIDGNFEFPATAYFTGVFNANCLVFGGTDTLEKHQEAMRALGLHVKQAVAY